MTRHYERSRAAVPAILQELKQRGYRFVTISELLEHRREIFFAELDPFCSIGCNLPWLLQSEPRSPGTDA